MKSASEKKQMRQLHAGVSCIFDGERKEPQIARNFHGFNYRDYLYKQNIHFILEATYISECRKTSLSLVQWILLLRQQAILGVTEMFPEQSGAFMNALLFGDRQQMTFEVEEQYQQFGLVHLLAISIAYRIVNGDCVFYFAKKWCDKGDSNSMSYLLHSYIYDFSRSVTVCYKSFYNRSFNVNCFYVFYSFI